MSEIKRKRGESFEGFMRRVKQQWLRSGKLLEVKKGQYFEGRKSKNTRRKQAVTRVHRKAKLEYLKKVGRLPPEEMAPKGRR